MATANISEIPAASTPARPNSWLHLRPNKRGCLNSMPNGARSPGETRQRASELEDKYRRLTGGLYPALLDAVSPRRNISRNHLLSILYGTAYDSRTWLDEGLSRMKTALLTAGQTSRLLADFIARQEDIQGRPAE